MIQYCSMGQVPGCKGFFGSVPTSQGVCMVFNGGGSPEAITEPFGAATFERLYKPPPSPSTAAKPLNLVDVQSLVILVDVHNSNVLKSGGEGRVTMLASLPGSVSNQVKDKLRIYLVEPVCDSHNPL